MTTSTQLGGQDLDRIVYSAATIARRVEEMGREISECYDEGDDLLVLGLLKGSFIFLADLVRSIDLPLQADFMVASSYGSGEPSLEGRAVIIVEDIVESGNTMNRLVPILAERGPKSLEICALLHKRLGGVVKEPRWVGFDAPEEFLVGYGLDFNENYRHLPYIASL